MAELSKREKHAVSSTSAEQLVDPGNAFSPDVDIYDTDEALVLTLDVPGVSKGNVRIEIDENNIMSVLAKTNLEEPKENAVIREFDSGDYFRAFALNDDFQKDTIRGKLENGVLEIIVPRKRATQSRRIQISA